MSPIINYPNVLSFLRIILTPFFLWALFHGGNALFAAIICFTIAALTDSYDGYLARRFGQMTEFGNFLDPIADKILIFSTFVGFYYKGLVPFWFVVLLLSRDTLITLLRWVMVSGGKSLKTSRLGKWKTALQFVFIYLIFIHILLEEFNWLPMMFEVMVVLMQLSIYCIAAITLYSGIDYLVKNRSGFGLLFQHCVMAIASLFYIGYSPYFPGTLASAVTAIAFFYSPQLAFSSNGLLAVGLLLVGVVVGDLVEQRSQLKDPSCVVIDEMLGMFVAVCILPKTWLAYSIAFAIFRFLDISKLFPINQFEKLPGGWGIMLDDLCAGMIAGLLTYFLYPMLIL